MDVENAWAMGTRTPVSFYPGVSGAGCTLALLRKVKPGAQAPAQPFLGGCSKGRRQPPFEVLPRRRPTLPRRCQRSTIGPGGLNFRVRDGNGCGPSGIATGNCSSCQLSAVSSQLEPFRSELTADSRKLMAFLFRQPHKSSSAALRMK